MDKNMKSILVDTKTGKKIDLPDNDMSRRIGKKARSSAKNLVKVFKANKTLRDYKGDEIIPGVKVAFNYSGQVRLGWVSDIKFVKRYNRTHDFNLNPYVSITIRRTMGGINFSKVSSVKNLCVIG